MSWSVELNNLAQINKKSRWPQFTISQFTEKGSIRKKVVSLQCRFESWVDRGRRIGGYCSAADSQGVALGRRREEGLGWKAPLACEMKKNRCESEPDLQKKRLQPDTE